LDGKGFEFKSNPSDQARAPKGRLWRKRKEGLDIHCTAKEKGRVEKCQFYGSDISWQRLCNRGKGNFL